jgi:DNA invertase Pin-like site-specific DNA recombinase
MKMFKNRGVKLCIVNIMGASVTLGTPMGDFILNLMVCIAQLESDQCSNRTKARFAERRGMGRYPGSRTPIGCKLISKVDKEKGRVVSDSRLFPLVSRDTPLQGRDRSLGV